MKHEFKVQQVLDIPLTVDESTSLPATAISKKLLSCLAWNELRQNSRNTISSSGKQDDKKWDEREKCFGTFFGTWPHDNRMSCAILLKKTLKTEGITSQETFLPFFALSLSLSSARFFNMNEIEIYSSYFVSHRMRLNFSFFLTEKRVALKARLRSCFDRRTLDMFIREIANSNDDNRKLIVLRSLQRFFFNSVNTKRENAQFSELFLDFSISVQFSFFLFSFSRYLNCIDDIQPKAFCKLQ